MKICRTIGVVVIMVVAALSVYGQEATATPSPDPARRARQLLRIMFFRLHESVLIVT